MKKGTELKQHFHTCMPLFIALGDEIRLTIIEALTDEALTGRKKNNPMNISRIKTMTVQSACPISPVRMA